MGNTSTTSGSNPSSDTRKVAEPISSTSATGRETGASATRLAASKPTLPKHTTAPIVQHSQPMALCGRRDRINAPTVANARNGRAPVHQSTIATTAACRPLSRASVKATADPPATSSHRPQASLDAERRRGRSWLGDLMPPGCEGSAVVWSMCCSSGSSPVLWSFPHDRPENVTGNDTVTTMASEQRRASKGTVPPRGVLTGSSGFRPPLRPTPGGAPRLRARRLPRQPGAPAPSAVAVTTAGLPGHAHLGCHSGPGTVSRGRRGAGSPAPKPW